MARAPRRGKLSGGRQHDALETFLPAQRVNPRLADGPAAPQLAEVPAETFERAVEAEKPATAGSSAADPRKITSAPSLFLSVARAVRPRAPFQREKTKVGRPRGPRRNAGRVFAPFFIAPSIYQQTGARDPLIPARLRVSRGNPGKLPTFSPVFLFRRVRPLRQRPVNLRQARQGAQEGATRLPGTETAAKASAPHRRRSGEEGEAG